MLRDAYHSFVAKLDQIAHSDETPKMLYMLLFHSVISEEMREMIGQTLDLALSKRQQMPADVDDEQYRQLVSFRARRAQQTARLFDTDGTYVCAIHQDQKIHTNSWDPKYKRLDYWQGFLGVSMSKHMIVGLRNDNTAVAFFDTAKEKKNGILDTLLQRQANPCPRSKWNNLKQVLVIDQTIYGLPRNGTVISTNPNACKNWCNIKLLQQYDNVCIGITENGQIVSEQRAFHPYDKAISVAGDYVLCSDGTVVRDSAQCVVQQDVIAIALCSFGIVFLKYDGTLTSTFKSMPACINEQKHVLAIAANGRHLYIVKENRMVYEIDQNGNIQKFNWVLPDRQPDDTLSQPKPAPNLTGADDNAENNGFIRASDIT